MKTLIALALALSTNAFAASKIESWMNGESIPFVVRDVHGRFVSHAELTSEQWYEDDTSVWVARKANGRFVTGYTGKIEKFRVAGMSREQQRLVIRDARGQFVTWQSVDDRLTAGFEQIDLDRDGDRETVYVIRHEGRFVNWAKAELEEWSNFEHPVLVVRDSADGRNNGKLLAWIAGEELSNGNVVYRDEAGRFISQNL